MMKNFIGRRPLATYFVLAYAITWGAIFLFLASRGFDLASIQMAEGLIIFLLMLLGPSSTSIILHAVLEGRPGLQGLLGRIIRVKAGLLWYAAALLTVPIFVLIITLTLSVLVSPIYAPSFRAIGLVVGLLAGSLEELGWTGFATPRLLKKNNPLIAGLILGLLWAGWHMLADYSSHISTMGMAAWPQWFVIYWLLPLTAYRILMTWVYSRTGSLLMAQLMHASYTGWLFTLSPSTPDTNLLWEGIFMFCLWTLVAIVFFVNKSRRGTA
jgi:uncharacterized protein